MPWLKCKKCTKDFYAKPRHIKMGWGKYCSQACSFQGMKTGNIFPCELCGKEIYRTKLEIGRSKSHKFFCNKSCFAKWKNKNILFGENHGNWKGGENSYREAMLRSNNKPICSDCGINNVNVLVIHHIDQSRKNNNINNLMWLCRNCHYIVHEGKTL